MKSARTTTTIMLCYTKWRRYTLAIALIHEIGWVFESGREGSCMRFYRFLFCVVLFFLFFFMLLLVFSVPVFKE